MTTITAFETSASVRSFDGTNSQNLKNSIFSVLKNARHLQLNSVWALMLCKAVILVVSAYDIYLTVKYVEYLPQLELNPVGRWMLGLDNGPSCSLQQAAAFITAKFAGNVVVVAAIEMLATFGFRLVGIVAAAVAMFQVVLGFYLVFASHAV